MTRGARYRNLLLVLLAVGGFWWALRPSPRDDVTRAAMTLSTAFSLPSPSAAAPIWYGVADPVTVTAAGTHHEFTKTQLVTWVRDHVSSEGPKRIVLRGVEVRVAGNRAQLKALLVTSKSQYGDLHAEERPIIAHFELEGHWKLRALDLGVRAKYIPEARP